MTKSCDRSQDFIRGLRPDKWLGLGVGDREVAPDRLFQLAGAPKDASSNLLRRQRRSGGKLPRLLLTGSQNLHVRTADIDNQHMHISSHVTAPAFRNPD